jgi:hypothetical protein
MYEMGCWMKATPRAHDHWEAGPLVPKCLKELAGTTGLEPAASAVTGQRSNQLNYVPSRVSSG